MKEFIDMFFKGIVSGFLICVAYSIGIDSKLYEEKTKLEIQKLKYELSVYKEMEESGK